MTHSLTRTLPHLQPLQWKSALKARSEAAKSLADIDIALSRAFHAFFICKVILEPYEHITIHHGKILLGEIISSIDNGYYFLATSDTHNGPHCDSIFAAERDAMEWFIKQETP